MKTNFKNKPMCEAFFTASEINTLIGSVNPKDQRSLFRKLIYARECFEAELQAIRKNNPYAKAELEELTDVLLNEYIRRNLDDEDNE